MIQPKILEVKNLKVSFFLPNKEIMAVRDVSFSLTKGKTLGLVGESGCGKSVTAYSILQLISSPGKIKSGEIIYNNKNLSKLKEKEIKKIRGKEIGMIFQEPMSSLNPVFTIGSQITEGISLHLQKNKSKAKEYTLELLKQVGIPNPIKRYNSYPHELSGGMCQRIMIAMSLAPSPQILIADEPTTALDVTIQAQILELLLDLQKKKEMTLLLITHDLGIVSNVADEIAIMYAGEIVEYGKTEDIFKKSYHPYTQGLLESIPKIENNNEKLKTIPGTVPTFSSEPKGCPFYERCHKKTTECLNEEIPFSQITDSHLAKCLKI